MTRKGRLHVWNTAVSAAFYGPLQGLEVSLRNAMNRMLGERYGAAWYDNNRAGFDRGALERIASARADLARDRQRDDPHRVVAALSFGFWVSLLGPGGRVAAGHRANYEMTLWRSAWRLSTSRAPDPPADPPAVEHIAEFIELWEDKETVEAETSYPQVGIRSFAGGLFTKVSVKGSET